MFCEKPEEKNMLEALMAAYPDAAEYVLDLNVWMYFNKRDEYIAIMDDLMAKNGENQEFISIDDERLRAIYPKEVKIIPPPQSENEPEPEVLAE